MASIQKRGSHFRARITREGKSTLSATFYSRQESLQWAKEIEAQLRLGIYKETLSVPQKTAAISFSEAAVHYMKTHSIHKKIVRSETYRLQILIARWKDLPISAIDKPAVLSLRDELLRLGRANDTINHYFNTISKLFQMLQDEWDLTVTNPIKGIKRMPPTQGRSKRITGLVEQLLLTACDDLQKPLLRLIIEFAIETGMRRGEIMGLTWADIDLASRKAYLHTTKNGEPRQVPLTKKALGVLQAVQRDDTGKVFPMSLVTLRTQYESVRSHAKPQWQQAGINPFDDLRFHDLRHEALSRLSDAGLNVIELSHISGHKTLGMLKRYVHCSHKAIFMKLDVQNIV